LSEIVLVGNETEKPLGAERADREGRRAAAGVVVEDVDRVGEPLARQAERPRRAPLPVVVDEDGGGVPRAVGSAGTGLARNWAGTTASARTRLRAMQAFLVTVVGLLALSVTVARFFGAA
jgi:hypothetical protein